MKQLFGEKTDLEMTMDDVEGRLAKCFSEVLPELTAEEITQASADSVTGWDSVTTVTLIAVIEDEFGISIEIEDPAQFDSFQGILNYLRKDDRREKVTEDVA
jgi:acyl carrier protein